MGSGLSWNMEIHITLGEGEAGITLGEGEASLNMLTPNSSPNSESGISFMYTRTLLWPYSSAFSVWPTGFHNHSKNHSVAMGATICYDEQLIYIYMYI